MTGSLVSLPPLQVLNRSPNDLKRKITSAELEKKEKEFFASHHDLAGMREDSKGVAALVTKLTQVQARRIQDFVPEFKAQVVHHASLWSIIAVYGHAFLFFFPLPARSLGLRSHQNDSVA